MYDVIIVGGSFGGLAVASQLAGYRVLLLDKSPIGAHQTSACGTLLHVLQHWGLQDAVLQTHDRVVVHTQHKTIDLPSPFPWCTFDYEHLCKQLFRIAGTEFIQASVRGYRDGWVETSQGRFTAKCIVDASGWRAILASSLSPGFSQSTTMNFGIETIRPISALHESDRLHFWFDKNHLDGALGWVFPRGDTASYGIGSYQGAKPLNNLLNQFTDLFNVRPEGIHGSYFPSGLRRATVGPIFLVGDAAGMCLGFTGEGIRPAMFFGESCGQILRQVLADEISLDEGLAEYNTFVEERRLFFDILLTAQKLLIRLPQAWIDWIVSTVQNDRIMKWIQDEYWKLTKEWTETNLVASSESFRAEFQSIQDSKGVHP
jgi:flavin-dependent dehydrogenase